MAKIYTRRGDSGSTGIIVGQRLSKAEPLFDFLGDLDELGAQLGVVCLSISAANLSQMRKIQSDLLSIGAIVAGSNKVNLNPNRIIEMEQLIDECFHQAGPLRSFILTGGGQAGAELYLARAIARRAERQFYRAKLTDELISQYLNRLSDVLFALARAENKLDGQVEIEWRYEEAN